MTPDQRFEILKVELGLIQATLDKYDDLIFRGRNFFLTLWLACVGLSFTIKSPPVLLLAILLSLLFSMPRCIPSANSSVGGVVMPS
jgi:hypothetical protein